MAEGTPKIMNIVINAIFFVLVAIFVIFTAIIIMNRAEPEFVISAISLSFPGIGSLKSGFRKRGFSDLVIFIILAVVVLAVLLALFVVFQGDVTELANSISSGIFDMIPFL